VRASACFGAIFSAAQWWIHLEIRVERAHGVVGEAQMVRRYLTGGAHARSARTP